MSELVLKLDGIAKLFGDFRALDGVHMEIERGSIHAILGENGAGKTTLMNILFGLYQPEEGEISLNGKVTKIPSPRIAMEMGIGMIHQHFMLVDTLTVAENVALGLPDQGAKLDLGRIVKRLAELSEEYQFDIDPHEEVWKLPIGMRQRVEILKVLFRDADIIILDEPTSVLAPNEISNFLDGMARLRAAGKTVIFITHKLDEVEAIADNVTIMQHGKVSAEVRVVESDAREMARLMVGREIVHDVVDRGDQKPGDIVLKASGLRARDNRGIEALKGVSLEIRAGEVLGIAGVDGNGQAELSEVITGLLDPEAGTITVDGEDITHKSVYARRHTHHVSYVPEDRHHTGLVLDFSIAQNSMLRDFRIPPFSRKGVINTSKVREKAKDWVDRYDVRMRNIDQHVRFLSGGNQQKLIFAREVECDPRVLVVMQPCKGLDVGAIEAVQRTVMAERANCKAVLYISTELEHIMTVADRIAVMCAGEITGILTPDEVTDERIGALMGGIKEEGVA
ncbi:MAG TPA: ABC transporter ATP-binding protein [Rhodobacteraceae bacterium]|jgi:simple sugar transport system ATP-binding protein|nr:ABC transporter ATP-binding protein [Paracoccaceae bacterium]